MFFCRADEKAQAILDVLPSIFDPYGGKSADEGGAQDCIGDYINKNRTLSGIRTGGLTAAHGHRPLNAARFPA